MVDSGEIDSLFDRVLELAKKGWGNTHPNPMVGALIVENGQVVAEGFHERAGSLHAEVAAFSELGRKPREGATLFVSLEPCSTHGRTPPCTDAIINSGIKQVYVGCSDPNPEHSNRGLEILRESGVSVHLAPKNIQDRASRLNFIFNHQITTGKGLVALKMAESANGMITENLGKPSRITEDTARADVMKWRRLFPGICVGSGTVLIDDPSLTSRIEVETWCPVRLVVDSHLATLDRDITTRKLYSDQFVDRTHILTTSGLQDKERVQRAQDLGVHLIEVPSCENGKILPESIRFTLDQLQLNSIYCEGGASLARFLLEAGEIDYLFRYRSPKVFDESNGVASPNFDQYSLIHTLEQNLGEDRLIHGFL